MSERLTKRYCSLSESADKSAATVLSAGFDKPFWAAYGLLVSLFIAAALTSGPAVAQSERLMDDRQALDAVTAMAAQNRPAWEIVAYLVEEGGLTVEQATDFVVIGADSPSMRSYATFAGMCLAPEKEERALDVGDSALQEIADENERARVLGEVIGFEPEQCDALRPRQPPAALSFSGGPGIVTPGDTSNPSPAE